MNQHYPFINMPLPYDYDALEPHIDTKTMMLHHNKHLQAYIDNLNRALQPYEGLHNWTLKELICYNNRLPRQIRIAVGRNAGGVYNHRFYFDQLAPVNNEYPIGLLACAIYKKYGDYEKFAEEWKTQAKEVFGSGYVWLVVNANGCLEMIQTRNQETPLCRNLSPLLCIDVWEHAYYLKHYNDRASYVDDWLEVVDWHRAEELYAKATNKANKKCA